jgi:uncharacterized protein YkwD
MVAFAASASPASAASACKRWGNTEPAQLDTGQARRAVLCLANRKRAAHHAKALVRRGALQRAAQAHTDAMISQDCFAHECPRESPLGVRLEIVDYLTGTLTGWLMGENIAWGPGPQGTPRAVIAGWMASPPHRAIMLSDSYRDAGIGYGAGDPTGGGAAGGVYTLDVGKRAR